MYSLWVKRFLDIVLSLLALLVLSPLFVVMTIAGAFAMKGNPFFLQKRPGKRGKNGIEKEIYLIKFRSMTNEKDEKGNFLPDKERLNHYGRTIRSMSLDELPSLVNILLGDLSIVGPRPLACSYLPYYTEEERHRHDVRPGLTGLAQVNGRNMLSWDEKFRYDLMYVNHITFATDVKIIFLTIKKVLIREGIGQGEEIPQNLYKVREDWELTEHGAVRPEKKKEDRG